MLGGTWTFWRDIGGTMGRQWRDTGGTSDKTCTHSVSAPVAVRQRDGMCTSANRHPATTFLTSIQTEIIRCPSCVPPLSLLLGWPAWLQYHILPIQDFDEIPDSCPFSRNVCRSLTPASNVRIYFFMLKTYQRNVFYRFSQTNT